MSIKTLRRDKRRQLSAQIERQREQIEDGRRKSLATMERVVESARAAMYRRDER